MLKYFFIIFAFLLLVVIAMAGFRGQKSSRPPIEIFPDMDRQPKVKAQTPSDFYADGRAARPPVEGTVPLGYSMPMHKLVDGSVGQATGPYKQIIFSSSPNYMDTGKMGENWGTGIPLKFPRDHAARAAAFRNLLRGVSRCHRRRQRHGSEVRAKYRAKPLAGPHPHDVRR